jgi:predicted transposase/invertase (TIGR01784 family)
MQGFSKSNFPGRILNYWAKAYARSLRKGQDYKHLKKVYSFNFLNYSLWQGIPNYLTKFKVLEEEFKFPLTDDLEIYIVELPKFLKSLESLKTNLDTWLYLLKEARNLEGESMKTLEKKNPVVKRAINELRTLSRTANKREIYESRLKGEHDYISDMNDSFEKGIEKGFEKARQTAYLGIQLNLETRFNIKTESLMKQVRKVKDIDKLNKLLIASVKAKTLADFKKSLK